MIGHTQKSKQVLKRVGIFAGTFDPVHTGHITFAKQALKAARLDAVYFLVERKPRGDKMPEHFAHRVAMIRQALKPHAQLDVIELPERHFSVKRTLPRIRQLFPYAEFTFLMGSDVIEGLIHWPGHELLLKDCGLAVGLREDTTAIDLQNTIANWHVQPRSYVIIETSVPHVSSSRVRHGLRHMRHQDGLLASVKRYSATEWLYAKLPHHDS